jgi:hypothetical protein
MPEGVLRNHGCDPNMRASAVNMCEAVGLGIVLVFLLAVTAANLTAGHFWEPHARLHESWCPAGEAPTFQFGFGALAQAIGDVMGVPIECEHGDDSSANTLQTTTAGIALYFWCTNTPSFTRGQEHWMLTRDGVEHWTGGADPPRPLPVVRAADLRHPCPK